MKELKNIATFYTSALGFENHGYAMRQTKPLSGNDAGYFYFEDFGSDWSKTYQTLATPYAERNDARIMVSRMGYPAAAWNTRGETSYPPLNRHATELTKKNLSVAGDYGLRAGITVPSWSPGLKWSFMTFSHGSMFKPRDMVPEMASAVYFTQCMQTAIDRLLGRQSLAPQLSDREREVLCWSAIGKTSWEISAILRISENTVNFHFKGAARKLGVNGRRAACARAISLGLIVL